MSRRRRKKKAIPDQGSGSPDESGCGLVDWRTTASALGVLVLVTGAVMGLERLRQYVLTRPDFDPPVKLDLVCQPGNQWIDDEGWRPRILSAIEMPKSAQWRDADLLAEVARRMEATGWVAQVRQVTKEMNGVVRVDCDYRRPIAMIYTRQGLSNSSWSEGFIPIDADGVRLPEEYGSVGSEAGWIRIFGVRTAPPPVGRSYDRQTDAEAAVRLARLIFQQPFAVQISAIDMANYRGRRDRNQEHIVLRTRRGGEIIWGSAIGEECEELDPAAKIRNIALFLDRGDPQAQVIVHLDRNGWREIQRPVVQTADSRSS
ncbi:MAG: hypothetical protein GXY44_12515 [Phycisphaerales bacterium]|nr:hypothetical protein [Phycisphaerales bacterium]